MTADGGAGGKTDQFANSKRTIDIETDQYRQANRNKTRSVLAVARVQPLPPFATRNRISATNLVANVRSGCGTLRRFAATQYSVRY
jgi:hypothetical protein